MKAGSFSSYLCDSSAEKAKEKLGVEEIEEEGSN